MTEREVMSELVRFIGVLPYGKERWFKQNGCWYDRMFGDYIQNEVLLERIIEAINDEIADRPTGEWIKTEHCLNDTGYRRWIEIECPFCGERPTYEFLENMNYCPNCGAEMVGESNG